jgi:hypothetical protein
MWVKSNGGHHIHPFDGRIERLVIPIDGLFAFRPGRADFQG